MFPAALLLIATLFPTTPPPAETVTLRLLHEWIDVIDGRDAAKMTAFWQKYSHDDAKERVEGDQRLVAMTRGFTLVRVVRDDGHHIQALLKEGRGIYSELDIDLASADPPLIQGIMGHPVSGPDAFPARPAANDSELAQMVRAHVAQLPASDAFSGSILIAHNGTIVLDRAWGMADRERQTPNTVDTQFCLGSMNKMFTAVAVLQLVQQGKLSLDGTIADYWPDYPNRDLAKRVHIRNLLSHTGGTGDIFTPEYEAHRLETRTFADYVKLFGNRGVAFDPGSRMEYSNYGFILLGRLVEIASGQSYGEYVQQHIFAPSGMTHTESRPESEHLPGRAVGYIRSPQGGLTPNTAGLPWSGTSAGGGYSTVGDLLRFAEALESGKLLDGNLLTQATTDQSHHGYGFGFFALHEGGYGHGGGAPGINGELRILPKQGYVIAVLANRDPAMATEMEQYIEELLP